MQVVKLAVKVLFHP